MKNRADQGFRLLTLLFLVAGLTIFTFPLIWMVTTSVKTLAETRDPLLILPHVPRWENFPQALAQLHFSRTFANTIVITSLSALGHVISCSLVGFGFAKFRFPGRNALFVTMLATMMLPPQVTMIPVFILFRSLGLVDTLSALIIPSWFGGPFYIFLFRQFFARIPEELLESARIDGASNWKIYWRIMLPLSWPVIAVVSIFSFIFAWNDYMGPLIYLNSPEKHTLALSLAGFTSQYGSTQVHLLMAASIVTMLPCVVLFFAAQRFFVDSQLSSGVKG